MIKYRRKFQLPDYANPANNRGIHAVAKSMDHFDFRLQCNAALFLSVWHKIEVQFYYPLNMVVVCHNSNCDSRSSFEVDFLMLTAVLNATEIERAISVIPTVQLQVIVNNNKISSTLIFWPRCRTDSFAWWKKKNCVIFSIFFTDYNMNWTTTVETYFLFNE